MMSKKEQARAKAIEWWKKTGRTAGNCDECDKYLEPENGYLLNGSFGMMIGNETVIAPSLVCEGCINKKSNIIPYSQLIPDTVAENKRLLAKINKKWWEFWK